MDNSKSQHNITYMLRHYLLFNVTDALSNTERGFSAHTQYFSGTGAAGQINYLERKPLTGGSFLLYYPATSTTPKTLTTDYTVDATTGEITWTGTTPASGTENIKLEYVCYKNWIYDDHPHLQASNYPRMTVDLLPAEHKAPGLMTYQNYDSGSGEYITTTYKIIVRNRASSKEYTYKSVHLKNFDLVAAIMAEVIEYLNTHRQPSPWKFNDWEILDESRIHTEDDSGILRDDLTIKVKYFAKLA
jgi:hypothetical protein